MIIGNQQNVHQQLSKWINLLNELWKKTEKHRDSVLQQLLKIEKTSCWTDMLLPSLKIAKVRIKVLSNKARQFPTFHQV